MRSAFLTAGLAANVGLVLAQQPPAHEVDPALFPGINASETLEWHDCYDVFKCARLTVPAKVDESLKKQRSKKCHKQDTVQLAIVRLPYVQGNSSMPPNLGTLHVQLGGWSQSNTNFLVRYGQAYAPLFLGYDLLAIDYRGHGWSTPSLRCFESEDDRQKFALSDPGLLGSSKFAPDARTERAKVFADSCKKNANDVAKYGGSYAAAVDHISVMAAMNQTRMSFWGVSSGGIVAQTIAHLYPEAVDKFLLDAPAPADLAYSATTAQSSEVADSNRALDAFFYTCLNAPADNPCNFTGNSTTPAEMQARYRYVDASLRANLGGIAVPGVERKFDWSALQYVVSIALHAPGYFGTLGGVLSEIESGQAAGWIPYVMGSLLYQAPAALPLVDENAPFDGILAGVCTDAGSPLRAGADLDAYLAQLRTAAPAVASIFADWALVCSQWGVETVNRYNGSLGPTDVAGSGGKVVVVNNIGDPASSLKGARSVRDSLQGAVLVETLAAGHTSFVSASGCFYKVVNELFVLGTMPEDGLKCSDIFTPPFGVQLPTTF